MNTAMKPTQHASSGADNRLQLLLFRLGEEKGSTRRELFGINVFKVREIVVAPHITAIVNAPQFAMGLANVRGQLIPVIDLPRLAGCVPQTESGIVLVTEFARNTQAFLVDEVVEIVQLDWKHLLAADSSSSMLLSGVARIDGDAKDSRLAQVLDVEQILRDVFPATHSQENKNSGIPKVNMPPGSIVLFADDSAVARMLVEESLKTMGVHFVAVKNGREAWEKLNSLHSETIAQGKKIKDRVALVLTDLEMPEMDGFTLTRNIKQDVRFSGIPVIVYSSLTGTASEGHATSVGADAYVAKFEPQELAQSISNILANSLSY
ncbi:chemotaxis protein [Rhodoferax saidenbachensis]|uniref:Two-component system chemotaxis response regulator CheV n=1 Tax=Rhodoferax saidenbachensis TaxID=1484693 RepID=A0ABU1ZLG1_9BURK|nr:chemotaxis protein [Rhodoferax saidenbachensis]MDR7306390.1 two-component system chemotaxis response regulator CheV [Rhodoferax saidenbachensis]